VIANGRMTSELLAVMCSSVETPNTARASYRLIVFDIVDKF
jgi:hypothetical protein